MKFSELEKLNKVVEERNLLVDFMEWITAKYYLVSELHYGDISVKTPLEEIVHDYLEINTRELNKQREILLKKFIEENNS